MSRRHIEIVIFSEPYFPEIHLEFIMIFINPNNQIVLLFPVKNHFLNNLFKNVV